MSITDTAPGGTALTRPSPKQAFGAKWREPTEDAQATLVNPYPGLRSFNVEEAHIFRARVNQTRALRKAFAGTSPTDEARHIIMVIGGSSSGKSSIVKAGLLADIHSLEMDDDSGNWYVAECRPVLSPMHELLAGLAAMVVDAVFTQSEGRGAGLAEKVEEALQVIGAAKGTTPSPDVDLRKSAAQRVRTLLDGRLWSARHQSNPASVAPALTLFVRETLNRLDSHLHPFRAGPPRLLISVDQFEEIFRCADGPEKAAVFDLIRFIDQAEAQGAPELYLVASMRSEELHRCSELKGVSDIVNRSVHLVELVLRDDARLAIVEPGRLTLMGYGFRLDPDTNRPYSKAAVDAMVESYDAFTGGKAEHRADGLPLLQQLLRLLWHKSVEAWIKDPDINSSLLIDSQSLSAVPGWDEPDMGLASKDGAASRDALGESQNRLSRVLNSRANSVFEDAIEAWCVSAGDSSAKTHVFAETILKAAFVSLVRQDDRRRVVRDWRTIGEMLATSSAAEKLKSDRAAKVEALLALAMKQFERATLIERRPDPDSRDGHKLPDKYTVYHESFIRNWAKYAGWVREAGKASATLHAIYNDLNDPSTEAAPVDIITAGREADLNAVIGDVDGDVNTSEPTADKPAMTKRVGVARRGWASQAWISKEISRVERPGGRFDAQGFLAELDNVRRGAILARKNQLELAAQAAEAKAQAANAKSQAAMAESREAEAKAKAAKAEALAANAKSQAAIAERREAEATAKAAEAKAEAADAEAKRAIAESREAEAKTKAAEAKAETADAEKRVAEAARKKAVTQKYTAYSLMSIIAVVSALGALAWYFSGQSLENQLRSRVYQLGLIGFATTEIGTGTSRYVYQDRDLWQALNLLDRGGDVDWSKAKQKTQSDRDWMRDRIVNRARQVLADLSFAPDEKVFFASSKVVFGDLEPVWMTTQCLDTKVDDSNLVVVSSLSKEEKPVENPRAPAKIEFRVKDNALEYRAGNSVEYRVINETRIGPRTICISKDGSAFLIIPQGSYSLPTVMLNSWANIPFHGHTAKWLLQVKSIRELVSWSSGSLSSVNSVDMSAISKVKYFKFGDDFVGFTIPISSKNTETGVVETGVVWTNNSFSSPALHDISVADRPSLRSECDDIDFGGTRCEIVKNDNSQTIMASYSIFHGEQKVCTNDTAYCLITIEISKPGKEGETIDLTYFGRPPVDVGINDKYLWIRGDDGLIQAFDRRAEMAKNLIALRWLYLSCDMEDRSLGKLVGHTIAAGDVADFYEKIPKYFDGKNCGQHQDAGG